MKLAAIIFCLGFGLALGKPFEGDKVEEWQSLEIPREATVTVASNLNVKEVWDRFLSLLNVHDLAKFIVGKLTMDPEAQAVFRYLRGEKVKTIVAHVMNDPEYIKFIGWLYEHGFTNIYTKLDRIYTFLGWDTTSVPAQTVVVDGAFAKSLQTLSGEFMEVLPLNAMGELALELSASEDPAITALLARMREPGMGEAWHRLKLLPEVQELGQALMEGSVGLEIFLVIVEAFFGW